MECTCLWSGNPVFRPKCPIHEAPSCTSCASLRAELEKAVSRIKELEEQLKGWDITEEDVQHVVGATNNRIVELEAQLEMSRTICDAKETRINKMRSNLAASEARVKELEELYSREIENHTVTEGLRIKAESRLSALEKEIVEMIANCGCSDDVEFCMNCQRGNAALDALKEGK